MAETRITSITLENFKNVKYGRIDLSNDSHDISLLGIYGQNGSGKTALVKAVMLLKWALCGMPLQAQFVNSINVEAKSAKLSWEFFINDAGTQYTVWYSFSLRAEDDELSANMLSESKEPMKKLVIFDELLQYSKQTANGRTKRQTLINTSDAKRPILPLTKARALVGAEMAYSMDLAVIRKICQMNSQSFVFSRAIIDLFRKNNTNQEYWQLINTLILYGNKELFVIDTSSSGMISFGALPLSFKFREGNHESLGDILVKINEPADVPESVFAVVEHVVEHMNIVLQELVPGLTIDIYKLDKYVATDGKTVMVKFQLLSRKNAKAIPFVEESEGIKKIVSILQLLILVYNSSSITVVVDELDAGIFEYLLGEILSILAHHGHGQLIFTSHNLRPLETLPQKYIAFTTTNPDNRYVRPQQVDEDEDLRGYYYRDIQLGSDTEELYKPTDNLSIAMAFMEAGGADV